MHATTATFSCIAAGVGVVSSSGGAALCADVKAPRHFVINVTTRYAQHHSYGITQSLQYCR
eukprot:11447-Heterococcus_DN1.PRE.1